jgi:hypothetical protein
VNEVDVRSDEASARVLLDELTSGQPDVPPDRYAAIVRRARRSRLNRAVVTLGVAAVVAGVAAGVGTSASWVRHPSDQRSLPGWALPWPDHRNGSVPISVLNSAVTAWRHQAAAEAGIPFGRTRPARVIWYVGQIIADQQAVAVIFEVDSGVGERLVAGWAATAQVLEGQPAWTRRSSPWVLYDAAAPRPSSRLRIGLNLHGTASRPGPNSDSWIVVLAAPAVWSMIYTWTPAPQLCCSGGKMGLGKTHQGLLVANVGQLGSPVSLLRPGAGRVEGPSNYVGVPGNAASKVPQLAVPASIAARPGFRPYADLTGQGSSRTVLAGHRGFTTVLVRCYGPSEDGLTLEVSTATQFTGVRVPCDNSAYQRLAHDHLTGRHDQVTIRASDLTAYRIVFGTVR